MTKIKRITQAVKSLEAISLLNLKGGKFPLATLILLTAIFAAALYAAPQSAGVLNSVDPNFDVQIQTSNYSSKGVGTMIVLPDDRMLISGSFNRFNRQPVGRIVRMTAVGLLDTTFNGNTLAADSSVSRIYLQPDGKIIVQGSNLKLNGSTAVLPRLVRLNVDGTFDPAFNYFDTRPNARLHSLVVYDDGKILINGDFQITVNGNSVYRPLVRMHADGTYDNSFNFTSSISVADAEFAMQNNKPIVAFYDNVTSQYVASRLNADGALDASFTLTALEGFSVRQIKTAPDNKIVILSDPSLRRLNENGGLDSAFQPTILNGWARNFYISSDGRITYAFRTSGVSGMTTIRRVLANGTPDPSFTTYNPVNYNAFAVQSDNEIFIGDAPLDVIVGIPPNHYVHLFANGALDTAFNPGGSGFQMITPGSIAAIAVQADQKVIMAGRFDVINEVNRSRIARLNADNTVDTSFQINTGASGNRFTSFSQIYALNSQPNGKIIVSGSFEYVLNGTTKFNLVRLNADGSIDSTFNLGADIQDLYATNRAGKNKTATQSNGKIIVGASRFTNSPLRAPTRLNSDGSPDSTLNPTFYAASSYVYIYDVAIQPNQKILICGLILAGDVTTGFVARLNADGSLDQSFQRIEESSKVFPALSLLADGKILIAKSSYPYFTVSQTSFARLNADGSPDAAFNAGTGANGIVHAVLPMPNGQTLVGGNFTTFNGQTRQNLVLINADGSPAATIFNVNQEVSSLAIDGAGRVLVGGSFTAINAGGGENYTRSYLARLTNASRTRFDFDGDGRADLGVFTAASGNWSIFNSQTNQISNTQFGQAGDRIASADYDGDGKTDIAVYRPSQGIWYVLRSTAGFAAYQWGAGGDKPVADDYDGDGKADIAVWRPSNGVWYILRNNGSPIYHHFGAADDLPVPADYDGDGKTDIAVWRPSNGTFYWLASGSGNQLKGVAFGQTGDVPAIADYDGDGKADLVVFRPSTGVWHQYLTGGSNGYLYSAAQFGQNGDEPVAADYDGDGRADIAVRRQGVWHLLKSNQGYTAVSFGGANAQAVAALPNQ